MLRPVSVERFAPNRVVAAAALLAVLAFAAVGMLAARHAPGIALVLGEASAILLAVALGYAWDRAAGSRGALQARLDEQARELARKNAYLQTLFDTAAKMTFSASLPEMLQHLVTAPVHFVGADASSIRLLDASRTRLEAAAHHGLSEFFAGRGPLTVGQGVMGRAVVDGQPVIVTDLALDDRYVHRTQALAEGLRSMAVVPLRAQDRVIGVLAVYSRAPRAYAPDEIQLLSELGNLAAMAIEKARLLEELKTRQARLEALLEVSRELSRIQPAESLLQTIAEACGYLLGAAGAGFRLVDGDDLVLSAAWGDLQEATVKPRLKIGESLSGWVAATGKPLLVADPANDPRLVPAHQERDRRLGIRAFLGVPVKIGDRVVGVLSARSARESGFSDDDLATALAFGSQAAMALENARLYQRAEERAEKLATFSALTRLITSAPDSREIFNAVAVAATTLLGAKMTHVWVADPQARVIRLESSLGVDPKLEQEIRHEPAMPYGQGIAGRIAESRVPEYIPDIQRDARWRNRRLAESADLHAFAGIPLIAGDHAVGVLSVLFGTRGEFSAEEKELMSLLADQAAITIERSRLFDELKQSYQQLERTQGQLIQSEKIRALGEMAGGVAHDFNNLLTPILGRAQFLLLRLAEGELKAEDIRRSLAIIQRSALDGSQTVRRLLEFTRATPRSDELEPVNLDELVASVIAAAQPRWKDEAAARGARIDVVRDVRTLGPILANPAELREVLLNLVFNAIDAMPTGGVLTLATWAEDGAVCLAVRDTGTGIAEGDLSRIFDPFFTTKGPQSSGLGLSVSYGIIRRHGGEIGVDSQSGQGATFTIRLPLRECRIPEGETAPEPTRPGFRILVVDDEPDVRETIKDLLSATGQEVWEAGSGREALDFAERQGLDLIVTDLGMPGMTGWDVAERIKARWPDVKIALMTGWGARVQTEDLKAHGVDFLLDKPVELKDLLRVLTELGSARFALDSED